MQQDFIYVVTWWATLFGIGLIFFPLTKLLFKNAADNFYIFSKVLGIVLLSYTLFVLGTIRILPFHTYSIYFVISIFILLNFIIYKKYLTKNDFKIKPVMIFQEILFFSCIAFWAFVRSHEPSIQSLEKFMDFGFVNSILRTTYFPPKDMWFTPFSINYYFFGHLATAVITKISTLPSHITYNLMIATLFAFTAIGSFSLVFNFLQKFGSRRAILGGLLAGILTAFGGNLHTLYAFFSSYPSENPVPPWMLTFLPNLFPNNYWYPNATRFIPFTIHEFPLYSFVVSDLHGHVLDIPFVLTTIALTYTILKMGKITKLHGLFLALFLAILYMTNIWDGIIYLLLSLLVFVLIKSRVLTFSLKKDGKYIVFPYIKKVTHIKSFLFELIYAGGLLIILYFVFTLPFTVHFKPFASGIGFVCPPEFLTEIKIHKTEMGEFIPGKIGPFLFEKDHCQRSDLYQLVILYGFFLFFAVAFLIKKLSEIKKVFDYSAKEKAYALYYPKEMTPFFVLLLIILSSTLILLPEFMYAKDIYPDHYRANTMFKLVYQAFIMLMLVSSYTIVMIIATIKNLVIKLLFFILTFVLLFLVLLYPYFAIKSYYNDLSGYNGLSGISYIRNNNPGDLEAINYLNTFISGQPVVLEAQGDSYTNFGRISANTGLPTVLGWTVHEWLWRGSYDIPAPRINEVETMYEGSLDSTLPLLKKYNVKYVVVGNEEKNKYEVKEENFRAVGKVVFESQDKKTKIYMLAL